MQRHPAFRVPKPGSLRFLVSEGVGASHWQRRRCRGPFGVLAVFTQESRSRGTRKALSKNSPEERSE